MAKKKKKMPGLNTSSTADISFMLLIFFLVTTSMDTDSGLSRRLPQPPDKEQEDTQIDVKERNVLNVRLNAAGALMCNSEIIEIKQLRDRAKEFIVNATDAEDMPEKEDKEIDMPDGSKWIYTTSKGVISLQTTRDTGYETYIAVQNELTRVFNEIREDVSMSKFGKSFGDLNEDERKVITTAVQQKISEAEPRKAIKK